MPKKKNKRRARAREDPSGDPRQHAGHDRLQQVEARPEQARESQRHWRGAADDTFEELRQDIADLGIDRDACDAIFLKAEHLHQLALQSGEHDSTVTDMMSYLLWRLDEGTPLSEILDENVLFGYENGDAGADSWCDELVDDGCSVFEHEGASSAGAPVAAAAAAASQCAVFQLDRDDPTVEREEAELKANAIIEEYGLEWRPGGIAPPPNLSLWNAFADLAGEDSTATLPSSSPGVAVADNGAKCEKGPYTCSGLRSLTGHGGQQQHGALDIYACGGGTGEDVTASLPSSCPGEDVSGSDIVCENGYYGADCEKGLYTCPSLRSLTGHRGQQQHGALGTHALGGTSGEDVTATLPSFCPGVAVSGSGTVCKDGQLACINMRSLTGHVGQQQHGASGVAAASGRTAALPSLSSGAAVAGGDIVREYIGDDGGEPPPGRAAVEAAAAGLGAERNCGDAERDDQDEPPFFDAHALNWAAPEFAPRVQAIPAAVPILDVSRILSTTENLENMMNQVLRQQSIVLGLLGFQQTTPTHSSSVTNEEVHDITADQKARPSALAMERAGKG